MKENEYLIVSDATVDLDKSILESLNVKIIPMIYIMEGKEYFFNPLEQEIDHEEFYKKVNAGVPVSTSQNPPNIFTDYYREFIKESKKILYICFSSGLSGNYNSAFMGAKELMEEDPDVDIRVVDSLCASLGEGFLLQEVCKKRDEGAAFDEIVEYTEQIKRQVCHWFVVGNLDQLARGGRINPAVAKLGSILNIHPILTTDAEGKLKVSEKVRGMKKALQRLAERFDKYAFNRAVHRIIVAHAGCPELADELRKLMMAREKIKECIIQKIGPVIGSHTGSPMCALVFMGEQE
ncbi:MAG: DegV family protein [Lachnospiraceae bacterium]|nr:DegV family protein [Lachnospiraceae bacterium]